MLFLANLRNSVSAADTFLETLQAWESPKLSDEQLQDGWVSLFDGESLFGWKNEGDANFAVEGNTILVSEGAQPSLLRTTSQFSNYQLLVTFLSEENTNSGVFLHTAPRPIDPGIDCYELNIASSSAHPFPTGSLVGRQRVDAQQLAKAERPGEWQTLRVLVHGDTVEIELNGQAVSRYRDPKPLGRGYIGLQFNTGRIAFGRVWLRPLGVTPLFNGKNLDGWTTRDDLEGEFSVVEPGELHVAGGRGQLETKQTFGDFVLQLECRTNAPGLNSGVFFRCIPGEVMNGYESQIHNGVVEDDTTRPADHGTGGIFRFQEARKVVAKDQTWFYKTIVMSGPHVAVWVNGFQVSDWTDQRKPDPNPRRGLRLEPGSFMLQAHDPTTDIDFRNVRAGELNSRQR